MTSNLSDYESHMQRIKLYLEERLQVSLSLMCTLVLFVCIVMSSLEIVVLTVFLLLLCKMYSFAFLSFFQRPCLQAGSASTAISSALISSLTHVTCPSWAQDYKVMS